MHNPWEILFPTLPLGCRNIEREAGATLPEQFTHQVESRCLLEEIQRVNSDWLVLVENWPYAVFAPLLVGILMVQRRFETPVDVV